MKLIVTNQNKGERLVRLIVSIFLLPALFIYQNNPFAIIQSIIGGILLFNAFSGMCIIYRFFGANTCKV
ncbi:MAG: YgaP family membrane protein [Flavobacteriales bacterium]